MENRLAILLKDTSLGDLKVGVVEVMDSIERDYYLINQKNLRIKPLEEGYGERIKGMLKFSDELEPDERMKKFKDIFGGKKEREIYELKIRDSKNNFYIIHTAYSSHTENFITTAFYNYFSNLNSK